MLLSKETAITRQQAGEVAECHIDLVQPCAHLAVSDVIC